MTDNNSGQKGADEKKSGSDKDAKKSIEKTNKCTTEE